MPCQAAAARRVIHVVVVIKGYCNPYTRKERGHNGMRLAELVYNSMDVNLWQNKKDEEYMAGVTLGILNFSCVFV